MRVEVRLIAALFCFGAAQAVAQPVDSRTAEAVAARDAGRTAEAIVLFEALSRERPNDPTVLRLLGTSYAAARRYGDAASALGRAQRLAPADQDIALARARVALWSERFSEASAIADSVAAAEPGNPELRQLRAAIGAARSAGSRIGVTAAQSVSRVSFGGPKANWHETSFGIEARLNRRTNIVADMDRSDRSRIVDTRLAATMNRRVNRQSSAYIGASVTPNADFRERWSLRAGGEARVRGAIVVTLDARHADYGASDVSVLEPGIRAETRDGRFALAVRSINLWDEKGDHRGGWAGRVDAAASSNVRLFAGGASYPGTEAGLTRRVDALFAGTDIGVTNALSLRVTFDHERRVETYRRTGVTIGLRWRPGE